MAIGHLCVAAARAITVSNVPEFLAALGSDRSIFLRPGNYDFGEHVQLQGEAYRFERTPVLGFELHISGLQNLQIVGAGKHLTHIRTYAAFGNVIVFKDCQNIRISGLKAGHWPDKGNCEGGVFWFQRCTQVALDHVLLYGSGIEGVTLNDCRQFSASNSIIEECSQSIMSLSGSQDAIFRNCIFRRNQLYSMVNLRDTSEVQFVHCAFEENQTEVSDFFEMDAGSKVLLQGGHFRANTCVHLARDSDQISLKQVIFAEDNIFLKSKFQIGD